MLSDKIIVASSAPNSLAITISARASICRVLTTPVPTNRLDKIRVQNFALPIPYSRSDATALPSMRNWREFKATYPLN